MTEPIAQGRPRFVERVTPALGLFAATLTLLPAISLVSEPFNLQLGIVLGSMAVAVTWFSLIFWAPKIVVTEREIRVGPAVIPRKFLGKVEEITSDQIFLERGPNLDPAAFTSFQSSVKTAVKIEITDPADKTPYLLVSTRKPGKLAATLREKP